MKKSAAKQKPTTDELLQDILIVLLAQTGLTQNQIRDIVGVDMNRVNRIVKVMRAAKPKAKR